MKNLTEGYFKDVDDITSDDQLIDQIEGKVVFEPIFSYDGAFTLITTLFSGDVNSIENYKKMAETAYRKISLMMKSSPLFSNVPDEITYTMGESGILDSMTSWCRIPLHVTQKQADDHPENRSIIGIGVHIPFKLNGKMTPGRLLPVINTIKTVTNKVIAKGLSFNPIFVINYKDDRDPVYPYPVMPVTAQPASVIKNELDDNMWTARFLQRTLHFFRAYEGITYINVINAVTRDSEMRKQMLFSMDTGSGNVIIGNPILLQPDANLSAIESSRMNYWYETGDAGRIKESPDKEYTPPEGCRMYLYPILQNGSSLLFHIVCSDSECEVKKHIGKSVILHEYIMHISILTATKKDRANFMQFLDDNMLSFDDIDMSLGQNSKRDPNSLYGRTASLFKDSFAAEKSKRRA